MKKDRPSSDLFAPRPIEVRPLAERMGRMGANGIEPATGAASSPPIRSLFMPPPAEPPPPPPPPGDDPEVQRQVEELLDSAERAGLQNAERKVQQVLDRYAESIRQMDERFKSAQPQASDVVSLAMVVAREIVGRELRVDGEPLITALDEALRQAGTHPTLVVRLCRRDLEFVKLRRADLVDAGLELVLDETLGQGGCVVEAPDQIVDASIEARLAAARDAVAAALDQDSSSLGDGPVSDADIKVVA